MNKGIIKLSLSLFSCLFILSACSFSFPWEKDRASLNLDPFQDQTGANGLNLDEIEALDLEFNQESLSLLRKFSDTKAIAKFIDKDKLGHQDRPEPFGLSSDYNTFSDLEPGLSIDSSVNLASADIVKVQGAYAYAIVQNKLKVIKVSPLEEISVLAEFSDWPTGTKATELAVNEKYLVVSGQSTSVLDKSFLKIFDISNPAQVKELRSLSYSGTYQGLRLNGDFAYFITTTPVKLSADKAQLPQVSSADKVLGKNCSLSSECLHTQAYYFNGDYDNYIWLSFSSINLADKHDAISQQLFLVGDNFNLYQALSGNIYLSHSTSLSEADVDLYAKKNYLLKHFSHDTTSSMAELIKLEQSQDYFSNNLLKIRLKEIIEEFVPSLSLEDREAMTSYLGNDDNPLRKKLMTQAETTTIHKFDFSSDRLAYLAKSKVFGTPIPEFAFNEDQSYLRLVISHGELRSSLFPDATKKYSSAYVLDESLKVVDALENIATNNALKSSLFINDRVYLQSDKSDSPVYVLNLSRVAKPEVLGAINITPYSLMQAYDSKNDYILALTDTGDEGLLLTIFDFFDIKNPKALSSYAIGEEGTKSQALTDPQALVNLSKERLIIVPALFSSEGRSVFNGALLFNLDETDKLDLIKRIEHNSDVERGFTFAQNIYTLASNNLIITDPKTGDALGALNLNTNQVIDPEQLGGQNFSDDPSLEEGMEVESNQPDYNFPSLKPNTISKEQAVLIIEDTAEKYYASSNYVITVDSISENYDLYESELSLGEQKLTVFLTKDGKLFLSGIKYIHQLSDLELHSQYQILDKANAELVARSYLDLYERENDLAPGVFTFKEEINWYFVYYQSETGQTLAFIMTKDGYLFFSQIAEVN